MFRDSKAACFKFPSTRGLLGHLVSSWGVGMCAVSFSKYRDEHFSGCRIILSFQSLQMLCWAENIPRLPTDPSYTGLLPCLCPQPGRDNSCTCLSGLPWPWYTGASTADFSFLTALEAGRARPMSWKRGFFWGLPGTCRWGFLCPHGHGSVSPSLPLISTPAMWG
jgi:hypothetical protein